MAFAGSVPGGRNTCSRIQPSDWQTVDDAQGLVDTRTGDDLVGRRPFVPYSASRRDSSEALPPTAVVFTEVVRSLTKRSR